MEDKFILTTLVTIKSKNCTSEGKTGGYRTQINELATVINFRMLSSNLMTVGMITKSIIKG